MAGDILQKPTLTRKYEDFILSKSHSGGDHGFAPVHLPDYLFDFQAEMVEWAYQPEKLIRKCYAKPNEHETSGYGSHLRALGRGLAHRYRKRRDRGMLLFNRYGVSCECVK